MLLIRKQSKKIPQTATANEAIDSQVPQVKFKTFVQLFTHEFGILYIPLLAHKQDKFPNMHLGVYI